MRPRAALGLFAVVLAACSSGSSDRARLPTEEEAREQRASGGASDVRTPSEIRAQGNHLLGEPSPYLRQHAHNPVNWYPWGEEALERARRENKPIFLSIGYSTCHWCHVMEHESFEDDEIAAYLNAHFIAIKVDREQRPDIDGLYLDAVSAMGGSTGWPLSVFLTPDLLPFFGGTYFPPNGGRGRPGFREVLEQTRREYADNGDAVAARGRQIFSRIEASARRLDDGAATAATVTAAMRGLTRSRDREFGGFGSRQKFPNSPLLLAELRYAARTGDTQVRGHVMQTLEQMMRGGIRDHLDGSFHRYAVDRRWHVPHFEKMLYDNAQLAQVFIEAGLSNGRPDFVAVGRGVLDDLIAHWQQDDGGFVVGFDADDPEGEGYYYTWTPSELRAVLGAEDAARFATLFGMTAGGERLLEGRSVLHRIEAAQASERLGMDAAAIAAFEARTFGPLREARARRRPPAMDDKELASWNGLAIIALATCGRQLDEPRYLRAAADAASFVLERLFTDDGVMLRGMRDGESLGEGFLDDYALPALGMLRLHAADGDARWLLGARAITDAMVRRYHDEALESFHQTARRDVPEGLPLRRPDLDDGVLPSGGTAAILLALELGAMAGDQTLHGIGTRALAAAASRATREPFRSGFLLVALDHHLSETREAVVAGAPDDPRTRALLDVLRPSRRVRVLPIRLGAAGASEELSAAYPALAGKVGVGGVPTAYVCEIGRCELPTSDAAELRSQLGLGHAWGLADDRPSDGRRAGP